MTAFSRSISRTPARRVPRRPVGSMIRAVGAIVRGLRAEEGNAMIEMALLVAVFAAPLLLGTTEISLIAYDSAEIQEAANAGAAYGMTSTTEAASSSGITSAAQADAPDFGANLSVTSTAYWVCATGVTGTQYSTQASATSACTGSSNAALEFLQVKTSATVTLPIHFSKLNASYTLKGLSVQEVE